MVNPGVSTKANSRASSRARAGQVVVTARASTRAQHVVSIRSAGAQFGNTWDNAVCKSIVFGGRGRGVNAVC